METHLGNRNVKVQVESKDGSRQEYNENGKRGVLKVGQLYFHAAELDSPTNLGFGWRRFETKCLPIRRLEILTNHIDIGYHGEGVVLTSKWSLLVSSSWWIVSEKITRGSRIKMCATCLESSLSMPSNKCQRDGEENSIMRTMVDETSVDLLVVRNIGVIVRWLIVPVR